MTLQRYNIALLPTDTALQTNIIRISRQYFLDLQDEYILGPEGLPHITLCQFKTTDPENARAAYNDFSSNTTTENVKLTIEKFHARPGKLVNAGKFIAEYKIQALTDLMDLQLKCSEKLAAHNLANLTPTGTYSPHITLARLPSLPDNTPSQQDLACPLDFTVRLSLGLSTEAGIFVKEL
ncbi:MAG: 2'-5' RNA ligase family protein [Rhodospirillales bacterium]|nr:2'-5' RNA ligase family protein [Rhodospirillales bacterium]